MYEPDPQQRLTLTDEAGRSLDCYIENSRPVGRDTYLLLMPVDSTVLILAWSDQTNNGDVSAAIPVEEEIEIEEIFADAKAVLAELDLVLQHTAFTLTVSGELPPLEEEDILTLELEEEDSNLEQEELQFLANFYHHHQKYSIYAPVAPLLFFAKYNRMKQLELVYPEDENLQKILEELLADELE